VTRKLKYEEIGPISHRQAGASFSSGDVERIARTLVALGLHDTDWKWAQQQCLRFLKHSSEVVVSAAIVALGHIARVNRSIDKAVVVSALRTISADPRFTGKAQDALDDIDMYIKDR
jgi:hypothetical protein